MLFLVCTTFICRSMLKDPCPLTPLSLFPTQMECNSCCAMTTKEFMSTHMERWFYFNFLKWLREGLKKWKIPLWGEGGVSRGHFPLSIFFIFYIPKSIALETDWPKKIKKKITYILEGNQGRKTQNKAKRKLRQGFPHP